MNVNKRIAGQRLPRIDATSKVTGTTVYGADFVRHGMIHGAILRSPYPHARIRRIDTSAAQAASGVFAVVTAADIPAERFGSFVKDIDVFARDVVRYKGHPIAAVGARTREEAEAALRLIKVEYEELPFVATVAEAMADGAPLVHERWKEYDANPTLVREGNIANHAQLRVGDAEAAFTRAWRVFEHSFRTNLQHPGYTEPRAAVAEWDQDRLTVWTNTQTPFEQQATLAAIFKIPMSNVRVLVPAIGGGFGGKLRIGVEHVAAALARKARRPAKVMLTLEEEIATGYCRQPAEIWLKLGVDRDYRIIAKSGRMIVDCGAMSGSGVGVASSGLLMLAGPYVIPNIALDGYAVYTNKAPTGSFRAPSGPQGNFACESQMDLVARELGIDPLEFRLKNIVRDGDRGPTGQEMGTVSVEECLRKAAEAISWNDAVNEPGRGKGIACGWWTMTGQSSNVYIKVNPDGGVVVNSGCAEIGTGAMTGAMQVLAEELGVDLEDIKVINADTASTPFDFGAQGSRTASMVGNACVDAVRNLAKKAFPIAAEMMGVDPESCRFGYKAIVSGDKSVPLAEVAAKLQASGGGLIAEGSYIQPGTPFDKNRTRGMVIPVINSPSYHAHAVDLSVDEETGEVKINKYVVAQDVGFAINPTYIEGQIEGGVIQGIGQAMFEELIWENGEVRNGNLTDYKMPTAEDAPEVVSILVEKAGLTGPYGAKGVGEPPVIEVPAALANAVHAASGVRITNLPITPEKIVLGQRKAP